MYAVLAEADSDYQTLAVIVKRMHAASCPDAARIRVGGQGFDGGSKLLKNGGALLKALQATGNWSRYIVCHDSDRESCERRKVQIHSEVIKPSQIERDVIAVVPVQEIEAWLIADINCLGKVFKSWRKVREVAHPELLDDPKEYLTGVCKDNGSPKYSSSFNHKIAEHLDLDVVEKKCPSFRPLADFFRR